MNLGAIGTSWITEAFINAANDSGKLTLKAVYSRSSEKAKEFAKTHSAPQYFTNIEEMAKSKEIEIVYIASPNSLHFEHALLFLKQKKHVICEKPIFSNTKELIKAFKTAEDNGVYLFEAIRNIHSPNFQHLKENIDNIGTIRSAMLHYLQYSSRYDAFLDGDEPNVFSPQFSGGALTDLGVYPLFLAVALFGKPEKFTYFPVKLHNGIDGNGTLILQYSDYTCTVACSKISQSYTASEIHGEKGTIKIEKVAPITKGEFIDNRTKNVTPFGIKTHENDMIYEIENFVNIIKTGNDEEYTRLKKLSQDVLSITETARYQNGILFATEQS